MAMMLRDTDVMADVLGFFTRREIVNQLAGVNVAFSDLCNCWCQLEEEEEKVDEDDSPRLRCWSCTAIHCAYVVRRLCASDFVIYQSNGTTYLRNINTGFKVLQDAGRLGRKGPYFRTMDGSRSRRL